jgi:tripeptidyl-peptidase-1
MHTSTYTGLLCTLAAPALGVVWESLAGGVPGSWSLVDKPSSGSTMALSIALSRQNLDQLESKVTKLSTPGQAEYGQWLDKSDIDTQFPVVDDTAVVKWLKSAGISNVARDGALLKFTGSVETVNKLLDTDFAYYQNGGSTKLRTTEYSIPESLTDYIDLVSPTVNFGKTRSAAPAPSRSRKEAHKASSANVSPACTTSITPSCLKVMYNVGDYTPKPEAGSRIGFGSFLNQSASYSDLAKYETLFDIPSQSFTVELLNGGVNNQSAGISDIGEANLDVQLIVAVSHPLPVHEFITGGVAYEPCALP